MRLRGKILLITGSTGIAAATATRAEREGAKVFTCGLTPGDTDAFVADLRDAAAANAVCQACLDRFGRIDALFNVAGASGRQWGDGPLHEVTDEGWDQTLASNLRTTFAMTRAVLRRMIDQAAGGVILNMSSVTAFSPEPQHFAAHSYAAAKGAIQSFTVSLASYYSRYGIRVNALAPGLVRTPMSSRAQHDSSIQHFIVQKQPIPRGMLDAVSVASAALFLLSDDAREITGQILNVDGGWSVS